MKLYLLSYDIPSTKEGTKRRNKVIKLVKAHGVRVQYSVFELRIADSKDLEELEKNLKKVLKSKEDSIRIYPIGKNYEKEVIIIGDGELFLVEDVIVF